MVEWRTDWKVGDKPFLFDGNRRVYSKDQDGRTTGGPIYSAHFEQRLIDGETSKSWLIGKWQPLKIPKKTGVGLYTPEMVELAVWDNAHRWRIADAMRRPNIPITDLKKIAEIIGYKVDP